MVDMEIKGYILVRLDDNNRILRIYAFAKDREELRDTRDKLTENTKELFHRRNSEVFTGSYEIQPLDSFVL
jgi:hypothetical protein